MPIKKSVLDDNTGLTALINGLGGQSLYRALYGQYSFASLIEFSLLSITATNSDGVIGGFAAVNDGMVSDDETFDEFIKKLQGSAFPDCTVMILLFNWSLFFTTSTLCRFQIH
jgi:hypothetical protein